MLDELCGELKNWFEKEKYIGKTEIKNGSLCGFSDKLQKGQFFRIIGSIFNDGVHRYSNNDLNDEIFDGAVWAMAVPNEVLALSEDIDLWKAKYESAAMSPFSSESFAGYSYTKSTGNTNFNGEKNSSTWQGAFANRMSRWRKI